MDINIIIQPVIAIIMLISVILISRTIKANKNLNQNILFNEIIKQERELRIKLQEYRKEIYKSRDNSQDSKPIEADYDTLLFNYYEYLSICLYKNLIKENILKLYFKEPLKSIKPLFEASILFKEDYAQKSQYPSIQWLFKKWNL